MISRFPAAARFAAAASRIGQTRAGRSAVVLVALICLALTAAHPAMSGALPRTDDAELHLNRLIALDYSVRHGDLWPRYAPTVAYGFGLPIFNYYSPFSLYPMEALRLIGLSFLSAFLIGTVLYTLLGLAGAYLLGKAWGGPLAGLVTAAAYAYAPYTLLNWPRRGAIPEFLALALLVWAMWAFWRLAHSGRRRDLALAAGFFTAIILTHNITALLGAALLAAYCGVLWWISPQPRRAFVHLALALLLPLGLGAFFWAPALLETDYILIDRVSQRAGGLGFRSYFETLGQVLAPPPTADLTQIERDVTRSLGWPQLALGAAGGALLALRSLRDEALRVPLRRWLLMAAPLMVILIFMTTAASDWLWRTLPYLPYFRYPWRMLGPASLLLAVAAGLGAALAAGRIRRPALRVAGVGAALLVVIVAGMPWLYTGHLPGPVVGSVIDAQNFERATGKLGGTSYREYVPRWTATLPDPNRLMGLYAQSEVIPRLQPAPGVIVEEATWKPLGAELTLRANEASTLAFDWLYFPGWRARLDGEPVAVTPVEQQGFVGVKVPAGEHQLSLSFGPTPLRRAAVIASLVSLGLLGAALAVPRLWRARPPAPPEPPGALTWQAAGPLFAAAALAGLLAFGGKALFFDRVDTPIRRARFADGVENGLQTPVEATFADAITLLGFDLPRSSARSGTSMPLTLYWALTGGRVEEDWSSNVMIRDAAGAIVWQTLSFYPSGEPTTTWLPGFYVREPLEVTIPPGTPPGDYTVQAGIYSHSLDRNLDALDADGQPVGVLVDLAQIEVTRPRRAARPTELGFDDPLNARLADDFALVGASPLPGAAGVGEPLPVIWAWRAVHRPEADVRARLVWLRPNGQIAARSRAVPLVTAYPADRWQRRDVWRGLHVLYVPGSLSAGDYEVAVQLYSLDGEPLGEGAVIGQMAVSAPPRSFVAPEVGTYANAGWANGVRLLGYDLPRTAARQDDGLSLTLYWQTTQELGESLTVFVHLIDGDGDIVAQRDQVPASGARPTTSWAPGEVIRDAYGLRIPADLPPGEYRLRVGWYSATTGKQVPLAEGETFWLLPEVIAVSVRE